MSTSTLNPAKSKPAHPDSIKSDCLRVDVRTPAEFGEVHIPDTANIPLPDLDKFVGELKAKSAGKSIALICRSGNRAKAALEQLEKAGLTNCFVLEGGVSSWADAGHPVERGKKAISIERQVRIAAGSLVLIGTFLGAFVHPGFLGISAFVGGGLVFAGITDTCGMGMMLAWLPYNRAKSSASCGLK